MSAVPDLLFLPGYHAPFDRDASGETHRRSIEQAEGFWTEQGRRSA
ncbi:MAG TPA: hypothetical protein VNS34_21375 [Rhizobiaceae bacterium]|nr:hypothetical protein [Rhizobiaceae bacterium]